MIEFLYGLNKMPVILVIISISIVCMLYIAQKSISDFDLKQMFIDPITNTVSLTQFSTFVALVSTTWGFIFLILNNQLTEVYLTIYIGTWAGISVVSKGITALAPKKANSITEITIKD